MKIQLKKTVMIASFCMLIYTLLGFFLVPFIAKNKIHETLQKKYGVSSTLEKISFNPFTFEVEVSNLKVPETSGIEKLELGKLRANLQLFPLFKKEIRLLSFYLGNTHANFTINKDGKTNWAPLPIPAAAEEATIPQRNSSPWTLTVEQIEIENTLLKFSDLTHREALQLPLGPINLKAENISTRIGSSSDLESLKISFGDNGFLNLSGKVSLNPVSANINFKTSRVPLDFISSYLSDKSYLALKTGFYDGEGSVEYNNGVVQLKTNSALSDFKLIHVGSKEPVAQWEKLSFQNLVVQSKPLKVRIDQVKVEGLSTGLVLRKDGRLNYKDFLRASANTPAQADAPPPETVTSSVPNRSGATAQAPDVLINKLVLVGGKLFYSDQQIKPNFSANISNLNGEVSPVTSEVNKKINVNLTGRIEGTGKFKAKGFYMATVKRPSLNLAVDFDNIELTTFTPYAGKFAGYEISKGKLFLGIEYQLKGNLIRGKNNAMLDQFTLGNKVESETATNLPLKLALALLKDRDGKIKINLPVEGDVNSPQFQMSEMIWTAVKNIIINIAAAPFDFLKGLLGGRENIDSITFVAGTDVMDAGQEVKIQNMAKFLSERPNLALEIQGRFLALDIEAIKRTKRLTDVPMEQLKTMAMSRAQKIQLALAEAKVEAERLYVTAASADDGTAVAPRASLVLKSRD